MAATIFEDIEEEEIALSSVTKKASLGLDIPESAQARIAEAESFDKPLPSLPEVSRTPETSLIEDTGIDRQAIQQRKDVATGLGFGTQIGGAETGQTELVSADSIIQILGAAGTGFLVGGPAGAVAGGLSAGLGVFLRTRAEKRKKKELAAKEARYQKAVQQQLAREDRLRKQERFDKLENIGFNRQATKMQQQWDAYKDFNNQIMGVINNNAALKERFATAGF